MEIGTDIATWKVVLAFVGTVLVAFIGAASGLWAMRSQIKINEASAEKQDADAAEQIKQSALDIMQQYKAEKAEYKEAMKQLEIRVTKLDRKLRKVEAALFEILEGASSLHKQVLEMNGTPRFVPPSVEALRDDLEKD